jgi:CHAT domain-containing protein
MITSSIKLVLRRRFVRADAFCLLLVMLVALVAFDAARGDSSFQSFSAQQGANAVAPGDEVYTLTPGETVRRHIKTGATHTFQLTLASKQYARIVVAQQGVDVVVMVYAPDGPILIEMDSPNGLYGLEAVSLVAQVAGSYRIGVVSYDTRPPGDYELRVEGPRESSTADETRVRAERIFTEAQKLRLDAATSPKEQAVEKYNDAIKRYEEAGDIWRELGDARSEGYALSGIGRVYKSLSKPSEALDHLEQSLSRLRDAQDIPGQAFVLNELGAAQRDFGDPLHALDSYSLALKLRSSINDRWGQAQLHNNVGYLYSNIGQQQKAIENLEKALPFWRAVGDRNQEMNTLNNIAKVQSDMGNMTFALETYQEVLRFCRESGNRRLEPFVLNSIGRIYDTWAESQEALKNYETALELFRKSENADGEAIVLDNIGMVYADLGDAERALEKFQDAFELRKKLNMPGGKAVTLSNIGYAQMLLGNFEEAIKQLDLALEFSRLSRNRPFEAYSLVRVGMAYISLSQPQKALEKYRQALEIQLELKDQRGQAITLDKMGQAYALSKESSRALDSYGQALERWVAVGDRQGQALSLYGQARVERDRHNLANARDRVEQAIGIVESLRYKMTSHQLQITYFAGKQDLYGLAIDVRMRLYELTHSKEDFEAALSAAERARARNLLDILAEARADLHKGMSAQDAEKSRQLEKEINTLTQSSVRLRSLKMIEDAVAIETRLGKLFKEQDDLQSKIKVAGGSYAELREPQPLGPRGIQQLLDRDTILLEYALGEERSYLWTATSTEVKSYLLPGQAEIERAAEQFREAITAHEPPKQGESPSQYIARLERADAEYRRRSLELSGMVLGPVLSQLENKRLVIVADGALQYIPFEALLVSRANGRSQASTKGAQVVPLIMEHEVVYQPSASTLASLRASPRRQASKTVAVLADPVFDSKDERVRASARALNNGPIEQSRSGDLTRALRDIGDIGAGDNSLRLERLKYTAAEADAITSAAAPGSWTKDVGFKASRATVLSTNWRQFKIVHFATHGILNSKNPELSGIVLSMVNEQGQPEDGFLHLRDIYNLNLPVDLVVLSACRTGIGKRVRGEGLISLTRGFMYAGASRVIASLWKVDDEATAALMKRFYYLMLKKPMPAATALRQARIEIMGARDQWRAPYYWAGFVLQGDWK